MSIFQQLDEIFRSTVRSLINDEEIIRKIEELLRGRGPPLHLRFRSMPPPRSPRYQKEILSIAEGYEKECGDARDIVKYLMDHLIRYFECIDGVIEDESLRLKVKEEFIQKVIRFHAGAGRA